MAVATMTKKDRVLKALRPRGRWVASPKLSAADPGLRRLRELRADGYTIEKRRAKQGDYFEYRLAR